MWYFILINAEREGNAFFAQQHVYFIYLCELSLLERALILDWLREGAPGEEAALFAILTLGEKYCSAEDSHLISFIGNSIQCHETAE